MVDNSHVCHEDVTFNLKINTRAELYDLIEDQLADMDVFDLDEWSFVLRWERIENPEFTWAVICHGTRRRLPSDQG